MAAGNKQSAHKATRRLGLERVENRELMAGDVTVKFVNNDLVITGDNASNSVEVRSTGVVDEFEIVGRTSGGSRTTINGSTRPFRFNNYDFKDDIIVRMNGGNDSLIMSGANTGWGDLDAWNDLNVEMGSGDDYVNLSKMETGGQGLTDSDVLINMGTGDNNLVATDIAVQDDFRVDTPNFSSSGTNRIGLTRMNVHDQLDMDIQGKRSYINVVDSVIGSLYADLYADNDQMSLRNNRINGGKVNGGSGTDTLYNYNNTGSFTKSSFETVSKANRSV